MLGHDGLFARWFPIVPSCFSHLDAEGFTNAGSTGLPSFGLLRNRGLGMDLLEDTSYEWIRQPPDPVGNQSHGAASPKPCVPFCWPAQSPPH